MVIKLLRCLRSGLPALLFLFARLPASAQPGPFPNPDGLAGAVEFWKQIFTRYDSGAVVFFDPIDPTRIYRVLRVQETAQGRAIIATERSRIVEDYDLVDNEIRVRSQRGVKNQFVEGLKISGRYMAEMEKLFHAEGLPAELALLPLVESSFNIRARSRVGAVGMWQFMPETGKKFLRIDGMVDERRDPLASTRAAARLLKQNYQILGSWPLAITAYNHGTEGMLRAINAVGSRDLEEIIARYDGPSFGFASKNFYAEFLAVVDIVANRETFFPYLREHGPLKLHEVPLKKPAPLHAVLKPAAISVADFFAWNPALEPNITVVPMDYRVRLPAEKVDGFLIAHGRAVNAPTAKQSTAASLSGGKPSPAKREPASKGSIIAKRAPIKGQGKASSIAKSRDARA